MNKTGFIKGAFIATLCIIITKIIGILYVIPFYSIIGEQGGALYGYAYNIYNFFLIISSAGIPLAISKITSEYDTLKMHAEKKYMFSFVKKIIYSFSFISFGICFLGSDLIANIIIGDMTGGNSAEDISYVIKCVSFALLIVPLLSILRGYMQGHKFISVPSISQIIEQVFRIAVILLGSYFAINVLNLSLTQAVGISVFGAFVGALFGYLYLLSKYKHIKIKEKTKKLNLEEKKVIRKKVIQYCIPFIAVNLSYTFYTTIDMILIIRTLNYLNFNANDIEAISSIFTTWGTKLIAIVTSISTGLIISLIPNMVAAYAEKNLKELNNLYQKTIEALLMIILPISIFLSIHSSSVWNILYGHSDFGPIIFRYLGLLAFFEAFFIIIGSITQNLNKFKLVYLTIVIGLGLNTLLDVPLMLLFNYLNIYPYYGAITATIIAYFITIAIVVVKLKKDDNISFKFIKIKNYFLKTFLILIPVNYIGSLFINNFTNRIYSFIGLAIISFISSIIYVIINYKLINDRLGKNLFDIVLRK